MDKLYFCFKTHKSLGASIDEHGNKHEAFIQVSLEVKDINLITKERYKEILNNYRKDFASMFKSSIDLIIPISKEEYDNNVDDDENDE